ncbi:MAG: molybdenum cofactor guanylyltransferase [Bacteroidota bacterium]
MHQKHPKLVRPALGTFARVEYSLVGTTCKRIEGIMQEWLAILVKDFRCIGITSDRDTPTNPFSLQSGSKQLFGPQAHWNEYDDRLIGGSYDLALVNGNHYPATRQIVFIDAKEAGTLERRKEQLTDIAAIVLCPGEQEKPLWLINHLTRLQILPKWYPFEQLDEVFADLRHNALQSLPPLKALILAGGKSTRMGTDKAQLQYLKGITEAERLADVCEELGLEPYLSLCESSNNPAKHLPIVWDRFVGMGPMGAICSAFLHQPDAAWLVLACDLPLLEKEHIQRLIEARDSRHYATAVQGKDRPFPEPLIAIYEPRAYQRLLQFLSLGYACPRKLLINSDITTLLFETELPLTNANTPEERKLVLDILHGKI